MRRLFFIFWIFPLFLNAQSVATTPRIIPPSPEAASISRYGVYPVSMSTGIPDISIPIYNIEVGDYSLPINISYHGAGIKVNDLASSVGLGWNLNAGGTITRTVMGAPDDDPVRGIFRYKIKRESQVTSADYDNFLDLFNGDYDTEPDVFAYNFAGKSGKFIFNSNQEVKMLPYSNLRVSFVNGLISITDIDGTVYRFEKISTSNIFPEDGAPKYYATTSWYLSKIMLNNKVDSITFTYTGSNPGRMEILDYHISLGKVPYNTRLCDASGTQCSNSHRYTTNTQPVLQRTYTNYDFQYVSNITFPGGQVNFTMNPRQDYGFSLDQITVTNDYNQTIKNYSLVHNYFFSDQGYNIYARPQDKYRLKLTALNETGATGSTPVTHKFEYNEQYLLPPRQNFGIDFWGYYNGSSNNQHLMSLDDNGLQYTQIFAGGSDASDFVPVNRAPSDTYMKADMLKRIYYPTGGYTDFEFEPNSILVDKVIEKPGGNIFVAAKKDDALGDSLRVATFISPVTISAAASAPATLTLNLPLWSDVKKPEIIFQNLTKGTIVSYRSYPGDATFRTVNIALTEGDRYRVSTSIYPNPNDPNDDTDEDVLATIKWPSGVNQTIPTVQKGPGLRIKSIKSYTMADSLARWEEYKYGEAESGNGKVGFFSYLFTRRTYHQNYTYCLPNFDDILTSAVNVTRLEILSKPLFEYSDFGGSSVLYTEVAKYNMGRMGDNIKTVYNYDYEMDDKIDYSYPDPQLLVSSSWKCGNLLSEKKYKRNADGTYQILTENINNYSLFAIDTTYGLIVGQKIIYVGQGTCMPSKGNPINAGQFINDFRYAEYPAISGLKLPTSTTNKVYANGGSSALTADITYTYNTSNYEVASITSQNSNGDIVMEVNRYPSDKAVITDQATGEADVIDSMLARNMVSVLIEKENFINNATVSKTHSEFGLWGTDKKLLALKSQKVRIGAGKLQVMNEIFNYDIHGNILEKAEKNDAREVYLWGYNNLYPVAKIRNTTYNAVSGLVNITILQHPATADALDNELQKLRNIQVLSDVEVSTYSYYPLTGTTSMKDPSGKIVYYEYDSFGRMITVRDANKMIIKQVDYQYQQPITK